MFLSLRPLEKRAGCMSEKIPLESYEFFTRHLGDREYFGQKLGLERISKILERLGSPEKKFSSVHIAGTNGKGSTAALLASVLSQAGFKVGLYTSPHLEDFCERIRIGDELVSSEKVLKLAQQVRDSEQDTLTFFEFTTVIAFLYFAEQSVDMAVVETGLGGRLDATNVIHPLVSVITSISYDHRAFLGNSLQEIAREKAGIIKTGIPVVVGKLPEEVLRVIQDEAKSKNSFLMTAHSENFPSDWTLSLEGDHQILNASVVIEAVRLLNQSGDFKICSEDVKKGLAHVVWPGRLETVSEKPWILLDGAHNVEAMKIVKEYLEKKLQGRRLIVIFGDMLDKDHEELLKEIAPLVDQFIFTAVENKRATPVEFLQKISENFVKASSCVIGVQQAIESVLKSLDPKDVLLITGSFFIVGEARSWFQKKKV